MKLYYCITNVVFLQTVPFQFKFTGLLTRSLCHLERTLKIVKLDSVSIKALPFRS